jgi:molecular chaperone DnaK (HSP70)
MIDETFDQIQLDSGNIDYILMVGGSSKIPFLRRVVESKFRRIPVINTDIYSSVAFGLGFDD